MRALPARLLDLFVVDTPSLAVFRVPLALTICFGSPAVRARRSRSRAQASGRGTCKSLQIFRARSSLMSL